MVERWAVVLDEGVLLTWCCTFRVENGRKDGLFIGWRGVVHGTAVESWAVSYERVEWKVSRAFRTRELCEVYSTSEN